MRASGSLVLRTVAWCAGVLLVGGGLLAAVVVWAGMFVQPAQAEPGKELEGPVAEVQQFARLAATDPAAALRSCTPARGTDFDALAGALPEGTVAAKERYTVTDGELVLLSAPVTGGSAAVRDGAGAVWAYGGQGFAAVTDAARELSPDLPGPQRYGVDPHAPAVERLTTCVEAAQRVSGGAGPHR